MRKRKIERKPTRGMGQEMEASEGRKPSKTKLSKYTNDGEENEEKKKNKKEKRKKSPISEKRK